MADPSVPAVVEMFDVALGTYLLSPASEPQLITPDKVHEVIRGLEVCEAPGPNGILNRTLKHLHKRAISIFTRVFNAVFRTHHIPQVWKHVRVKALPKPGKGPALPSCYRPISLLDTIGIVFEKNLLATILHVVNESGLLRDEQFGFIPGHSTSLQLARFIERIARNVCEKRPTGAVFLDVAKAFDTVWIEGLLYKLTLLKFPSYIVHTISSYLRGRTFEASFQTDISSMHAGRGGSGRIDLPDLLQSACQRTCLHPRTTSRWPSTRTTRPS